MRAEIIDGAAIARGVRTEVAHQAALLTERGTRPGLAVVLVGDDPASAVYVRMKRKACEEAGMHSVTVRLSASTTQEELLAQVDVLNADPAIHGFLVQMPLPKHIDPDMVVRRIDPQKDVDGFHPVNVGKMLIGERDGFLPATAAGVQELLARSGVTTVGADCVIVGRSNIVGKPMAALMVQNGPHANSTVTVVHSRTPDIALHTRRADVLIVAAGKAGMVRGDMVKPGAVVVDVGTNRVAEQSAKGGHRLVGDVAFDEVREVASRITPVPGGVGPMTIAMLLRNTIQAAERAVG
ncbi:MAG: bifunctional 5,10-methylene-tetrahydrofolate dehydrogenase/5,10-methylene-tetrahydrofolate cyclohydrolase [Gemmatimonadota bacterium]|nr:bifunctional 5,10-methylene-tetrahydrofolate dehydrogenase/5,10-methylene-tetrahydrofolate cyclohydrolase [Gemmatimonadota bacterium]